MCLPISILIWTISAYLSIIHNASPYFIRRCFFIFLYGTILYFLTFHCDFLSQTQIPYIPAYLGYIFEAVLICLSIYLSYRSNDNYEILLLAFMNILLIVTYVILHESFKNLFFILISLVPIFNTLNAVFIRRIRDTNEFILFAFGYAVVNTLNYFCRDSIVDNYSQFNKDFFIWCVKMFFLFCLTALHLHASYFLLEEYENRLGITMNQFKGQGGIGTYCCHKFALIFIVLACLTSIWIFEKFFIDDGKWTEVLEILVVLNYCLPLVILLRFPQPDLLSNMPHKIRDTLNLASAILSFLTLRSLLIIIPMLDSTISFKF